MTVLAEPGTRLVRMARRDFQPEFSAHISTTSHTQDGNPDRWREIQEYNLKICG
jgi:hypothetical protein